MSCHSASVRSEVYRIRSVLRECIYIVQTKIADFIDAFWVSNRLLEVSLDDLFPKNVSLSRVGPQFRVYSTICGSKWRFPAAGRRVRYAWRPAATRAGGSKLVAAARIAAACKGDT